VVSARIPLHDAMVFPGFDRLAPAHRRHPPVREPTRRLSISGSGIPHPAFRA